MSGRHAGSANFAEMVKALETLRQHYRLIVVPTLGLTLFAVAYAMTRSDQWKASQAILVRDEAVGSGGQGRFDSVDEMQTTQETVLEMSRNPVVVKAALKQVGPDRTSDLSSWPTRDDVASLRHNIDVAAPRGAEFGRTEVIYLSVTAGSPERAVALTEAVCDHLENHLQKLRDARAASIVAELTKTLQMAQADLAEATSQLASVERAVGVDLGDLRGLIESGTGDNQLRTALTQLINETRQLETRRQALLQQREILVAAKQDPDQLIATPDSLLDAQSSIRRLKDGLVDAQLRKAELLGRMNVDHPRVLAAVAAEQEVRQRVHEELDAAIANLDAEAKVGQSQQRAIEKQIDATKARLDQLAGIRARYSNLIDDLKQKAAFVDNIKVDLAEANASRGAAQSASTLTRVDAPFAPVEPEGPGALAIILAGAFGGAFAGVGLVFLAVSPMGEQGRRFTDSLPMGRRATDFLFGRRAEDREGAPSRPIPGGRRSEDPPLPQVAVQRSYLGQWMNDRNDRRAGERRQGDRRANRR